MRDRNTGMGGQAQVCSQLLHKCASDAQGLSFACSCVRDVHTAVPMHAVSAVQGRKPGPPAWTPAELELLCAIVFEFGPNWLLVSDIFSSTVRLFGIHRSPQACHERYRAHMVRLLFSQRTVASLYCVQE